MLGAEGLVDAFVAEHVWEHLSLPDAHRATRNCARHLRPGGRLRIAVPNPAWYSASAGPSSTSSDGGQASIKRGDNHTASLTQTEGSKSFEVEKAGIGGSSASSHNGSAGDSIGGGRGDASEEGESRRHVAPGRNEVGMAGRTAIPSVPDLPDWLSQESLLADARDRHLVQFTPELLANVCWSAGLIPFLLEGGGRADEQVVTTGEQDAAGAAAGAADEGGDKDSEENDTAGNDNEREEPSGLRRQKGPPSLARFPTIGEVEMKERQPDHLWGHIRRSAAGGDPRGVVSIVMDCVKSTARKSNTKDHHPESFEAGRDVADDQPTPHDEGIQQGNFHGSEGLTPLESEPSSSPPYLVPSQQRSSVFDHSLIHTETSQTLVKADRNKANRGFFAGPVAGITSGVSHGPGADGSVAGGVVALGKAGAADAPAAANTVVDSYDRSTGIVVRPVASQPRDNNNSIVRNNNRAGGQGHAFGGVGMGVGTAVSSCRGLLCDGGGQSDDAAGSGEGG